MRRSIATLPVLGALAIAAAAGGAPRIAGDVAGRAAAGERVRVLVELAFPEEPGSGTREAAREARRGRIAAVQAALARDLGGTPHRVVRAFRAIPFAALEVEAAALDALARSPRVARVVADDLHAPLLDVSVPLVEADQVAALGFDGAGQTIAVIDTGVDALHPNLDGGKVVAEACFASGEPGPVGDCPNGSDTQSGSGSGTYCDLYPPCFHGTHVAGIAAGEGPNYDGVAPGASIISIQVASVFETPAECSPNPAPCVLAFESDMIAALEEVYDLRSSFSIAAMNMSLGGATWTSQSACDAANAALKAALDNLRSVDIAPVIAAGNNGLSNAICEPGCISSAVSVGATTDSDAIASFSNHASFLSLWAPGDTIRAPRYMTPGYTNASGTSMATPHVAGAWALLRQAVPGAGVDEILLALQTTGVPIVPTTRIRVRAALDELTIACDDGFDDDGDGLVDLADPGCADAADDSERGAIVCDDDQDQDGDGFVDFPDDPGCKDAWGGVENPKCQDGLDNDNDGGTDFDGGASLNGGVPFDEPDSYCGSAWQTKEKAGGGGGCGLGFELAPLLAVLRARRHRS